MTGNDERPRVERLQPGTVLIAGGGPVGLLLSQVLSYYNVRSVLFERNKSTTLWPKMDLTNARSMEFFKKLGLADELRKQGVPAHIDANVLISSGLLQPKALTLWELPSVDKFRKRIHELNDGTQPREPWQRISQAIFERWLKQICDEDPLIDLKFGNKIDTVVEENDCVRTTVTNVDTGVSTTYISEYVAGCDGASSRVRRSLGSELDGGPVPVQALLVHFKSRDLTRLHKQGQFWHIFFLEPQTGGLGGAIIAQDEVDTWTTHMFLPLDVDTEQIGSHEAVYRILGGLGSPFEITIDEILVRSVWRPSIAVTETWSSPKLKVHLAGDAAHVNIPTGGYGMNMGIADAFDLGWKLASVINGYGGPNLLRSYEPERKPVAQRNVQHSGVHFNVHTQLSEILAGGVPGRVDEDTTEAKGLRSKIHDHYQLHDGENKDFGIEMGYRYKSPVIIPDEDDSTEPSWSPSQYTPTTWPGGRAPSLFLQDGTALYDKFGKHWTLLVFSLGDCGQDLLVDAAKILSIPMKRLDLADEDLAKKLYERQLVLIRPDHHVAWRANKVDRSGDAERILKIITGQIDQ